MAGSTGTKVSELAWAAGFFDGEGSILLGNHYKKGVQYRYLRANVQQNDRRPLDRFVAAVGAGKVNGPYAGNRVNPIHNWNVNSAVALGVIGRLWPYLSAPKREQALRVAADLDAFHAQGRAE